MSNTWYYSNGSVPNAQDVALIETVATRATEDRVLHRLSRVFWTGGLAPNHLTTMGYPCNLDSCTMMQRNDAQSFAASNNTAVIGSAMRGGASGGPWIQDFGVTPTSNPAISGLGAKTANAATRPTAGGDRAEISRRIDLGQSLDIDQEYGLRAPGRELLTRFTGSAHEPERLSAEMIWSRR